jgi:hypothetical protein
MIEPIYVNDILTQQELEFLGLVNETAFYNISSSDLEKNFNKVYKYSFAEATNKFKKILDHRAARCRYRDLLNPLELELNNISDNLQWVSEAKIEEFQLLKFLWLHVSRFGIPISKNIVQYKSYIYIKTKEEGNNPWEFYWGTVIFRYKTTPMSL